MSMALHSSKIAAESVDQFLRKEISRQEMEDNYARKWQKEFATRLQTGRFIQSLFGKTWATGLFINAMKKLPYVTRQLIKHTHGKPF
jgi:menaquinone-9 beta-reductase